ncbi:thiopeptide-type bacteriocin biosynthesis protein [Streptomyces sp. NBC_01190]|uniref:lantibiotic dehydratase n=1 Tax=Streptomyces sp. NBC_01190 TaxID=2903767 RepID=UPI00386CDFB1|nr:lantibiotic dehydratase [Streptomyces sp. NBC_01190]
MSPLEQPRSAEDRPPPGNRPPPGAPRYTAGARAILRIPALAADRYTAMLDDCPADRPDWATAHHAFLQETWRLPHVPPALRHAAPALLAALGDTLPSPGTRAALALDRYVNRMSTRPTPFGLLAGVVGVPFAADRDIRLEGPPAPRPRRKPAAPAGTAPDAPAGAGPLAGSTSLIASDLAHELDGHLWREPHGQGVAVWLRGSAPALALLRAARHPQRADTLVALLGGGPDGATPATAAATVLVTAMVRTGFLRPVPDSPPRTRADIRRPLAGAQRAPGAAASREPAAPPDVAASPDVAALPDVAVPSPAVAARPTAGAGPTGHLDAIAAVSGSSAADPRVARLAETAASLLALVGRGSRYPRYLARAAEAFTAHYGEGARVPVLETVHTLRLLRVSTEAVETGYDQRDALLAELVTGALAHRRLTCELDDALVTRLVASAGPPAAAPPLPGVDVCLRVARDGHGVLRAALSGFGAAPAGTGYGRFTDLLDDATRGALQDTFRAQESAAPDRLFVELSYRPGPAAAEHVTARDRWRGWEMPVDVAPTVPPHRVVAPADILVAVESGRFEFFSARLGRRLYITQSSALGLHLAPPVCRFLLDASANSFRHPAPFDWGSTGHGPFLPRLARGPLVVAPARWRLRRVDLTGEFTTAVGAWAKTWMVPRHVRLVRGSEGLLLDLRSAVSLAHLRAALDRAALDRAALDRAAPGRAAPGRAVRGRADAGVLLEEVVPVPGGEVVAGQDGGRYLLEAVVPVTIGRPVGAARTGASGDSAASASAGVAAATVADAAASGVRTAVRRSHPPGGDWLALHLALPHRLQDTLITRRFPDLRAALAARYGADRMFFVRYADPVDELRIRLRCADGRHGALLDDLLDWTRRVSGELPVSDVSLRTYRPETDRYGGPALIGAAEALFDTDSAAVAEALARKAAAPLPWAVLTAASVDRIAAVLLPDRADRLTLAARLTDSRAGSAEYRAHGSALWELRSGRGPADAVPARVAARWTEGGAAYALRLGERWPGSSGGDRRLRAAASLLHMHTNRMGLGRAGERAAFGLWRRLLERDAARFRTGGHRTAAADLRERAAQ